MIYCDYLYSPNLLLLLIPVVAALRCPGPFDCGYIYTFPLTRLRWLRFGAVTTLVPRCTRCYIGSRLRVTRMALNFTFVGFCYIT